MCTLIKMQAPCCLPMRMTHLMLCYCRVLREYLKEETYLPEAEGTYNLERIIDDFVLLCVLVGNDFLPHSPTLDINEGGMDLILETYRDLCVRQGVYLTQGELISHVQIEALLKALAEKEFDTLVQRAKVCQPVPSRRPPDLPRCPEVLSADLVRPRARMHDNCNAAEEHWGAAVQDQIEFEQRRRGGGRGGFEPGLSMPSGPEGDGADSDDSDSPGDLFSAEPTMMTGEARDMLLSGDAGALTAYKKRSYRKMDANTPDKVRLQSACRATGRVLASSVRSGAGCFTRGCYADPASGGMVPGGPALGDAVLLPRRAIVELVLSLPLCTFPVRHDRTADDQLRVLTLRACAAVPTGACPLASVTSCLSLPAVCPASLHARETSSRLLLAICLAVDLLLAAFGSRSSPSPCRCWIIACVHAAHDGHASIFQGTARQAPAAAHGAARVSDHRHVSHAVQR